MEWWKIYLLTRLNEINNLFFALSIVLIVCIFFLFIWGALECGSGNQSFSEFAKKAKLKTHCFALLLSTVATSIFPNEKDIAIILAGHWATHNEEMKKLPENVLKTLNAVLENVNEKVKK